MVTLTRLSNLCFKQNKDLSEVWTLDDRNVARLKKIFELEECLKLDSEHHVSVIINVKKLNAVIQQSLEVQTNQLHSY